MPGITQTEAFKNAERLERAIALLGELTEQHGIAPAVSRALADMASDLARVLEGTGLRRILQIGQAQSLQHAGNTPMRLPRFPAEEQVLNEAQVEATIAELLRGIDTEV